MPLALSTAKEISLGIVALVFIAFALASSFVFPRMNPNFPGRRLGIFLAAVVLLTIAQLAAVERFAGESKAAGEKTSTSTTTGTTTTGSTTGAAPTGDAAAGKAVFASAGCSACHTLKEANASGKVGPNLDETLKGKDAAFIHQSIVDPNAYITPGFPKGVMPQDFGKSLSSKQIDDLVALLYKASH